MKIHFKYFWSVIISLHVFGGICVAQQHPTIYVNEHYDALNQIITPLKKVISHQKKYNKDKLFVKKAASITDNKYWSNKFGPYGIKDSYGFDVDKINGNILFVGSDVGLARSLDGGNTWNVIDSDFPIRDVKIDPNNTKKVFAVGESGYIFISTDLGETWQSTSPTYSDWFSYWSEIAISPFNSNLVFIGANDLSEHLLKSTDGGYTWQSFVVNGIGRLWFIKFHPTDSNKVYIGGENGVFYSSNAGSSWQQITQGLPSSPYTSFEGMAFKPSNPDTVFLVCANSSSSNKVFMSKDGGITWSNISGNFPSYEYFWTIDIPTWNDNEIFIGGLSATYKVSIPNFQVVNIFQNGSVEKLRTTNNKVFLSTRYNGLYRSDDYGITFQESNGNVSLADIRAVKFNPQNSSIAVAAGWTGGIFRTVDGSNTWSLVWSGGHWNSVDVCKSNPNVYYVCGAEGFLKSTDGGLSWNYLYSGAEQFIRIKCNPVDPNHVICLSHYGANYTAIQTYDGGKNWSPISDIPGTSAAYLWHDIVFNPVDTANIFICDDNGIYRSTNSGKSWNFLTQTSVEDMHSFIDDNNDVKIYGTNGNWYNTIGSSVLSFSSNGNFSLDTLFSFPNAIANNLTLDFCRINPNNGKQVYLLFNSTSLYYTPSFLYSSDGGKNWVDQSNGLRNGGYFDFDIDFSSGNRLLANVDRSIYKWIDTTIGVIPVELISFTANQKNSTIELNWSTATETNNKGFEIQKSVMQLSSGSQNKEWKTIGFINGKGTTTEIRNYLFVDKDIIDGKYFYRLKQIDFDGSYKYSKVIEVNIIQPTEFVLNQNYPNPFNPTTIINYSIPKASFISIKVYDVLGREIETLVNDEKPSGNYKIEFNGSKLTSGIYFYRMQAGDFVETKKLTVLK